MKFFAYNGSLKDPTETGSFYQVAKQLNLAFEKLGVLPKHGENVDAIIFPECLNARQSFINHVPYLASEYSLPPKFVVDWLNSYNPKLEKFLTISEFSRRNLIRGGIEPDRIYSVHLGSNPDIWFKEDVEKFEVFTFLSVNSSNDRSAFEVLVPEFLKFATDKNVRLVIKDGYNPRFEQWLLTHNSDKIVYIGDKYSEDQLRRLYNLSHYHVYYNHSTSFGMTNLDAALCGTPSLVTLGSAPQEFTPKWTQTPYLVKTETKPLNSAILDVWGAVGLHIPPPNLYPSNTTREAIIPDNIIPSLEYAYSNYNEMVERNGAHQEYIKANLSWDLCAQRIIEALK